MGADQSTHGARLEWIDSGTTTPRKSKRDGSTPRAPLAAISANMPLRHDAIAAKLEADGSSGLAPQSNTACTPLDVCLTCDAPPSSLSELLPALATPMSSRAAPAQSPAPLDSEIKDEVAQAVALAYLRVQSFNSAAAAAAAAAAVASGSDRSDVEAIKRMQVRIQTHRRPAPTYRLTTRVI